MIAALRQPVLPLISSGCARRFPRSSLVILLLSCIICSVGSAPAQTQGVNRQKYRIHIKKTDEPIEIDGLLQETVWSTAEKAENFPLVTPIDTGFARAQTEVMLTYDDSNLYVGIICYDPTPGRRPVESLRRDFSFGKNDNFIVFIDTYNDLTNGFAFGVSAAGAQWEGSQANGGFVNLNWDIKWNSAVQNYENRWVAEFAIPFRSMRYNEGATEWGINFSRLDLKTNEKSSWAPMPRNIQSANLGYAGTLIWDEPLGKAGLRYSIIPYVSAKMNQDNEAGTSSSSSATGGMDAKIILSTSLNLDLTVNPDYSQVDVDTQQTNLDRFELFFPEKRRFFLENSDLFANLGEQNVRPFFSRRIGLDRRVDAGARLSGNLTDNWRIGMMNMQVASDNGDPAANFSVGVLQRKVFSRSNFSLFMVNKDLTCVEDSFEGSQYNRVLGFEYNLLSADNHWTGKAFFHKSFFQDSSGGDTSAAAANLTYATRSVSISLDQTRVGDDYKAEVGYIRRRGYYQINPDFRYRFLPNSRLLISHGPSVSFDMFRDTDFNLTDRQFRLGYSLEWQSKDSLSFDVRDTFVKLQRPFDPTNTGGVKLEAGTEHEYRDAGATFQTDTRKLVNYQVETRYGSYYNGTRWNVNGLLYWRVQPISNLALASSFDRIQLPEPYNSANLFLIGPKLDLTFTDSLFLTSYVQYNNQIDNLNLNIRLQWRFAPVSDLFIVYSDNSYPEDFQNKNRGLVMKVSYWFN
ncbi:MAG: carbohydrate binding family 9 domain-containing protein [Acidobacteriota bacterium]|nr:MAG: carbohydrate binding family 9 domain-containing protein [Acidobacteriota bacterium]